MADDEKFVGNINKGTIGEVLSCTYSLSYPKYDMKSESETVRVGRFNVCHYCDL